MCEHTEQMQGPGKPQSLYHNVHSPVLRQCSTAHVMPHFRQPAYVLRYFFSELYKELGKMLYIVSQTQCHGITFGLREVCNIIHS